VIDCPPDFSRTAVDYARHRAGFPPELLDRLIALGVARPGARVVDLGTGTGSLARLFARHGCDVTGVDIAGPLLEQARRLDREAGLQIAYVECSAEATGLPSGMFDVVSAGQCWHWFDRPAATREVARLLAGTGTAVIAHFDWLPVKGNVVEATEEIILRYTPTWPFAPGCTRNGLSTFRPRGSRGSRRSPSMWWSPIRTRRGSVVCAQAPPSQAR
jgi:ubiquinone/menaquinone biosynthesis C-methylase UbiE